MYENDAVNSVPDNSSPSSSRSDEIFDDVLFAPKRVLILTKLTRLEYERRTNPNCSEEQLEKLLRSRGSDYMHLVDRHNYHMGYLELIQGELRNHNIETRTVYRFDYTDENIDWADAVFSAGGDGTFLLAASKIPNRSKPVVGINTDPLGSEGYMCLTKKLPREYFKQALKRLFNGNFEWLYRQRIRIELTGVNAHDDPVELHNQQLLYPEHRWVEHVREYEEGGLTPNRERAMSRQTSSGVRKPSILINDLADNACPAKSHDDESMGQNEVNTTLPRRLPCLALNEVFIGESVSSRVSYFETSFDGTPFKKMKNSGLTVCSGTGSTSWYFNINRMSPQCVKEMLMITNELMAAEGANTRPINVENTELLNDICAKFNSRLIFEPDRLCMAYAIRDPVVNSTFKCDRPRGFVNQVDVKSRCFDAHLVIDGGLSFRFNRGTRAHISIRPEDALRTAVFR